MPTTPTCHPAGDGALFYALPWGPLADEDFDALLERNGPFHDDADYRRLLAAYYALWTQNHAFATKAARPLHTADADRLRGALAELGAHLATRRRASTGPGAPPLVQATAALSPPARELFEKIVAAESEPVFAAHIDATKPITARALIETTRRLANPGRWEAALNELRGANLIHLGPQHKPSGHITRVLFEAGFLDLPLDRPLCSAFTASERLAVTTTPADTTPYEDDLDLLQEETERFRLRAALQELDRNGGLVLFGETLQEQTRTDRRRQLLADIDRQDTRCRARLAATLEANRFLPRVERLVRKHDLNPFERDVLLLTTATHVSKKLAEDVGRHLDVEDVLELLAGDLRTQIERRSTFYRDGALIASGLVRIDVRFGNLGRSNIEVDPRIVDYLLGLETEASQIVEGTHLYHPQVRLDQVVLPNAQKKLAVETAEHFTAFQAARAASGIDDELAYGRGLSMLFYGPPGTGKTMLANALARHLGKRLLLINFALMGERPDDELLRFLFREAALQDAVLFFDECEEIFGGGFFGSSATLRTEFERHDGLTILATNKPDALDEPMRRRITLALPFHKPDAVGRRAIWERLLPSALPLADDVDLDHLAERYALPGGLIKNAVLAALSRAAARLAKGGTGERENGGEGERESGGVEEGEAPRMSQTQHADGETKNLTRAKRLAEGKPETRNPKRAKRLTEGKLSLSQRDLEHGARHQLQSLLSAESFEHKRTPRHGLDHLVLEDDLATRLGEIVALERSRRVLFGQWGFDDLGPDYGRGTVLLFHGPPGTGKTAAAEALGYELGRPLRIVTPAEVLSCWVGQTSKTLTAIFNEAAGHDAILLIDEADSLLGTRQVGGARHERTDVNTLLRLIEHFDGLVVLTTNLPDVLDPALLRRVRYRLPFQPPNSTLRRTLWERTLPDALPLADDVDLDRLADRYALTGAGIRNAALRAAAAAAARPLSERRVSQSDLERAAAEEAGEPVRTLGFRTAS